jgi:hypothetical protein
VVPCLVPALLPVDKPGLIEALEGRFDGRAGESGTVRYGLPLRIREILYGGAV